MLKTNTSSDKDKIEREKEIRRNLPVCFQFVIDSLRSRIQTMAPICLGILQIVNCIKVG